MMKKLLTKIRGKLMEWAIREWANKEMDQWETFQMKGKFGTIYVQIVYSVPRPDDYFKIDK